ncbi:MAG: nuclear transport factor 2 family protein [Nitrosopumilaceae archaeon]
MVCLHFFTKSQLLTNAAQNLKSQQNKQTSLLSDREQIINVIETFFESGKTKDLTKLKEIQLDDSSFSSFSDVPPYDLKDFATTVMLEELKFVSISDYDYAITNPKISIFGDTAVAAFELNQKGMLVDNKAYTGEHISINGRATFVLVKMSTWKIVHIHLSKIN